MKSFRDSRVVAKLVKMDVRVTLIDFTKSFRVQELCMISAHQMMRLTKASLYYTHRYRDRDLV